MSAQPSTAEGSSTSVLAASDLQVGEPLPWPVYDPTGRLLLGAGQIINDIHTIEALVARSACRPLSAEEQVASRTIGRQRDDRDPFVELGALTTSLAETLSAIMAGRLHDASEPIAALVDGVESLTTFDDNAVLGSLLLNDELGYSIAHAWMCATLCDIVGRRLSMHEEARRSLIAAALTSNVGMFDIQDALSEQQAPLDGHQSSAVRAHPAKSVALLRKAGISDPGWLRAILEHHERLDGSGYPGGLNGDDVGTIARLLALADIYSAMILPRRHRDGIHAKTALREIFTQRGAKVDAQLAATFIKETGVFPPGVLVRLQCGETAIVIRRNPIHAQKPIVRSVCKPSGKLMERTVLRDSAEATPYAIVEALPRRALPFSFQELWGYRKHPTRCAF